MYGIYFLIGLFIGFGFLGFIFAVIAYRGYKNLSKSVEELNTFVYDAWYEEKMQNTHNKIQIETIDDFLKEKFPDMNRVIMEKYAHVPKGKTYPQRS